jgi:hypothetical protein
VLLARLNERFAAELQPGVQSSLTAAVSFLLDPALKNGRDAIPPRVNGFFRSGEQNIYATINSQQH